MEVTMIQDIVPWLLVYFVPIVLIAIVRYSEYR